MTIHKRSNICYIKKGLLLTVIRTRGLVETRWCAAAEAKSQVITWSFPLTLCASYMSPPLLPPPLSRQLRPSFSYPALSLPVSTLTRGMQGCPKTISLDKNIWHSTLEDLSNPPFFCRFASVHFCNTFCQKMLSFFRHSTTRESFPDFSFITAFFTLA